MSALVSSAASRSCRCLRRLPSRCQEGTKQKLGRQETHKKCQNGGKQQERALPAPKAIPTDNTLGASMKIVAPHCGRATAPTCSLKKRAKSPTAPPGHSSLPEAIPVVDIYSEVFTRALQIMYDSDLQFMVLEHWVSLNLCHVLMLRLELRSP
jgi:hypothetical protein